MMQETRDKTLRTETELRTIYTEPNPIVRDKAFQHLDEHTCRFIALSPFFCIGSSRPDGLGDVSPRGGEPGFVHVLYDTRIAFPDRPGNNRLDTLTNISHTLAVGLLFFLPGVHEMLRINGMASISADETLMNRFLHNGKKPRSVIVIETREIYMHCSKALRRADLWNPDNHLFRNEFPTFGQIVREQYNEPMAAGQIDEALD